MIKDDFTQITHIEIVHKRDGIKDRYEIEGKYAVRANSLAPAIEVNYVYNKSIGLSVYLIRLDKGTFKDYSYKKKFDFNFYEGDTKVCTIRGYVKSIYMDKDVMQIEMETYEYRKADKEGNVTIAFVDYIQNIYKRYVDIEYGKRENNDTDDY